MLTPLRVTVTAVVLLAFAGLMYSEPQAATPAIEQFQATIKRLEAEIQSLRETIAQLKGERKTDGAATYSTEPQGPATSRAKQARAAYNDGRNMEDEKLYRAAVEAFSESIQLDPLNDAAFLHRGYCFHQLGDDTAAAADFTQSLAIQPNNSRAYLARATANAAVGQRAQALDDADEAIRRDSKSTEAYLLRGRLYQQQGDSERALADFTAAQTLSPKSEQAYLGRAETNLRDGKTDEAIADCDAVVRLNPNSFAAYLCRAHAYIQVGKSDRAVEEISKASRAAQSLDLPLAFLNDTWQAMDGKNAIPGPAGTPNLTVPAKRTAPRRTEPGKTRPAVVAVSTRSKQPEADTPVSLEHMARKLIEQKNFAGAFILLNRAIALDPSRATSYNTRGLLHLWMRHYDLATADFSDAIRVNPVYRNAYRNRARTHRALGDQKQADDDDSKADGLSASAQASALSARR